MNVDPTSSCSSLTRGLQSGWYAHGSRYGCSVTTKPSANRSKFGQQAWTIVSPLLGGIRVPDWRRAWTSFVATQWDQGRNFDKASFSASYTITNVDGTVRTATGFDLFMHYAITAGPDKVWFRYSIGDFTLPDEFWETTPGDSEPAPPAIVDASWDGVGRMSITLSNYTLNDVFAVLFIVTPPGTSSLSPAHLIAASPAEYNPSTSHIFLSDARFNGQILKPFTKGKTCLLGMRVWTGDPRFFLPSPIAAELITIG